MTTTRTDYRGRHSIRIERAALRYVRVLITPDRGGDGKYVDLPPRDAFATGWKMIRLAFKAWRAK